MERGRNPDTLNQTILNSTVLDIDDKERKKGIAGYKSNMDIAVEHIEDEEYVQFAKGYATIDEGMRWTASALKGYQNFSEAIPPQRSGDSCPLPEKMCTAQNRHNDPN